jgi:hypothetical protein
MLGEEMLGHVAQAIAEVGDIGWGKALGQSKNPS